MIKQKISAQGYFLLLFLSSMCSVFMYLSSPHIKIAQTQAILRPVIFIVVSFIVAIPAFYVVKEHKLCDQNRMRVSKAVAFKIIAVLYAIGYFVTVLKTISRFDLFVSSELFPDKNMVLFLLGIVIVCAGISMYGMGTLTRASVLLFVIVILSTTFVMLSLTDEISLLNFTPIYGSSVASFLEDGFLFSFQITELGTLVMLLPYVEGNVKRSLAMWSVLSGIAFSLVLFFVVGSLGSFADTQLFPTYAAVTLASFGLLERIDALETSIWIICVVQKISFYIFIITRCARYAFSKLSLRLITGGTAAALCAFTGVLSLNIERFEFLSSDALSVVLFVALCIALPISIIFALKVVPREKVKEDI